MITDLNAHSHCDSALYPDSGFQSDSGLSKSGTDSGLHPHVCLYILTVVSSLSDYSPQHSPHSYFHVIIICSYPAVRVKFYAYVNMMNNKLTYYLLEKDSSRCKPATTHRKEQDNANDSFGKGFRVLKDHVLNLLMTGRCPSKYCSYGRSSTRFFSKIASIFKKVLHLKDLNRHLEYTGISFNPENGSFSKIKK